MSRLLKSAAACLILSSMAFAQNAADESAKKNDAPKMLSVGDKAPAINDIDWIKGKGIDAFAPGDSYVVECWATWCGPCRPSLRHVQHLHHWAEQNDKSVAVYAINQNEAADQVKAFWSNAGFTMPTLLDPGSIVGQKYGTVSIPVTAVINRGKVAYIYRSAIVSYQEFQDRIEGLLDSNE